MSFFHVYSVKIFDHDMTLFFQTSFGRSMQRLQVIKERYFITILAVLREKIIGNIDNFFEIYCIPWTQISWKMTTFFFERYRPEINPRLHKWCCEQISRRFRSFWGKKNFSNLASFFFFFCISGVTDFLKNDQLLFWEIPAWNLSWTAQMVLRTNFKAFKVVSSEKKIFQKFEIFWLFLHIRGHRFLEKWPTSFLRDTGLKFFVDCTNGVANKF